MKALLLQRGFSGIAFTTPRQFWNGLYWMEKARLQRYLQIQDERNLTCDFTDTLICVGEEYFDLHTGKKFSCACLLRNLRRCLFNKVGLRESTRPQGPELWVFAIGLVRVPQGSKITQAVRTVQNLWRRKFWETRRGSVQKMILHMARNRQSTGF